MNNKPVIALVIPCYNEEEVLPETSKQLLPLMQGLIDGQKIDEKSKIFFVDDGSKDKTWLLIEKLAHDNSLFGGLKLSRNRGHQNALIAGLTELYPSFDALISLDADLQDDINAVKEMIEQFKKGNDVVYAVRSSRKKDSFFKKATAEGFYHLMAKLGVEVVFNHADYRLLSQRALKALSQYTEVNLFLRAIIPQLGYPCSIVYYERNERFAGESKYPLKKMLEFAFQGITSFSSKPLSLIRNIGILFILFSFAMAAYTFYSYFMHSSTDGWSSLMLSIWFVGGCVITCLGIVGEYIGKIYQEVKGRPRYFIEQALGLTSSGNN